MIVIIFTWCNNDLVTKTTCFGLEKVIKSHEKGYFI